MIRKEIKIILICVILLIVFMSFSMFIMFRYVNALTSSPLVLGAQKISNSNKATSIGCSCAVLKDNRLFNFYFNDTTIWDDGSYKEDLQLTNFTIGSIR